MAGRALKLRQSVKRTLSRNIFVNVDGERFLLKIVCGKSGSYSNWRACVCHVAANPTEVENRRAIL